MTTNVLIVNRGLHDVEVTEHNGNKRTLQPSTYADFVTYHGGNPIIIREVPPTPQGA